MTPPIVSLAAMGKKEPGKLSFDEVLLDKLENSDSPSVITIETERRARLYRRQKKQKRCRIIVGSITILVIVAVAVGLTFTLVKYLKRHHKSWTVPHQDGQYSTDVRVDDENNLINAAVYHGADKHQVVMIHLYEYNRLLVAYKDVQNGTCYIDRIDETYEVGYQRWQNYQNAAREPIRLKVIGNGKPIEVDVLTHIGDRHIFGHCSNGTSFWAMELEETETTTDMIVIY